MPKVLNAKKVGVISTKDRVYVGRPTKWGNPYLIGHHGTREEIIAKYRRFVLSNPELVASLPSLRGKDLVCWCAPFKCHADVLLELANGKDGRNQ